MAGEWIKMRRELLTSPKVVRIMSALNADRFQTIGGLFAVWCLFDEHTEDGKLVGYTTDLLDKIVGFPGISAAMVDVGWIAILNNGQGLHATNFEEHNGRSAKRRAQECVRKMSARNADKNRTRSYSSSSSKKSIPDDDFVTKRKIAVDKPSEVSQQHWDDWLAVRKAKRAGPITETALSLIRKEAQKAGATLDEAIGVAAGQGWQTFKADYSHGIEAPKAGRLPTMEERKAWRP